ncbi:MAG: hypothetical protein ACE5I7_03845 [Candidatus Binatia bacterium]
MQLIATGKWSKADKRWKMVVALRRPAPDASRSRRVSGRGKGSQLRPGENREY